MAINRRRANVPLGRHRLSLIDWLHKAETPTFTWNDLGDDVLILSVGDDYSVVSLLTQDTWSPVAVLPSVWPG